MKRFSILASLGFAGLISSTLSATPIGNVNEANCNGGGFTVSMSSITFLPAGTTPNTGCVFTGLGTSVTYSGGTLAAGVQGNVKNLTFSGGPVDQFLFFPTNPTLDFILTSLGPGSSNFNCTGLAIGGSCSVGPGTPFILTNLGGSNTTVSLSTMGLVTDSTGTSNFNGAFTTQLNLSPDVIQSRELAGLSISSTQSAQFILAANAVPEPGTLSMLAGGAGLLVVGLKRRKD